MSFEIMKPDVQPSRERRGKHATRPVLKGQNSVQQHSDKKFEEWKLAVLALTSTELGVADNALDISRMNLDALQNLADGRFDDRKQQGNLCEEHFREVQKELVKKNKSKTSSGPGEGIVVEAGFNDIMRLVVFGSVPLCGKATGGGEKGTRRKRCSSCTVNNGVGGGFAAKAGDRVTLFDFVILLLIVANTIVIVYDLWERGDHKSENDPVISGLQNAFLALFTVEAALKMFAYGSPSNKCCRLGLHGYFSYRWNIFDFSILVAGWAGMFYKLSTSAKAPTAFAFRIFRLFRALRALRVFSAMKIIGGTMTRGANAVVSATILFGCFAYLYSMIGHFLFNLAYRDVCTLNGTVPPSSTAKHCALPNSTDSWMYSVGALNCAELNSAWACERQPATSEINMDNYDNAWQSFLTASVVMSRNEWYRVYLDAREARSYLTAVPFHVALISTRIVIELLITAVICVMFALVRDNHFKLSGNVTSHYERIRRSASFMDSGIASGDGDSLLRQLHNRGSAEGPVPTNAVERVKSAIRSAAFANAVLVIIFLNMIFMVVMVTFNEHNGAVDAGRAAFAAIYLLEMVLKMFAYGVKGYFVVDSFNWFDFVIALFGIAVFFPETKFNSAPFQLFRIFRCVRVVRLVRGFPSIQEILTVVLDSNWTVLLVLTFNMMTIFIFAVLATSFELDLYSDYPQTCTSENMDGHPGLYGFGKIQYAALTLYVSFGGGSAWEQMRKGCKTHILIYAIMILWVAVISNILSKLIIGVVVSNFDASDSERKEFNEQQFKALRKMHTLETKARICTTNLNSPDALATAQGTSGPGTLDVPLYKETLGSIMQQLGGLRAQTLDGSGKIPTQEVKDLLLYVGNALEQHICHSLMARNARKAPTLDQIVSQIMFHLSRYTHGAGIRRTHSQLIHALTFTSVMIHLAALDVDIFMALRPLHERAMMENNHFKDLLKDLDLLHSSYDSSLETLAPLPHEPKEKRGAWSTLCRCSHRNLPLHFQKFGKFWDDIVLPLSSRFFSVFAIVLIACFVFMFAGYNFFKGKIGRCKLPVRNVTTIAPLNKDSCTGSWENPFEFSFDTIGESTLTILDLLALNNLEDIFLGISKVMTNADPDPGRAPSGWYILFPGIFILLVPRFLLHLFAGVFVN